MKTVPRGWARPTQTKATRKKGLYSHGSRAQKLKPAIAAHAAGTSNRVVLRFQRSHGACQTPMPKTTAKRPMTKTPRRFDPEPRGTAKDDRMTSEPQPSQSQAARRARSADPKATPGRASAM